ncbi:WD repeat-containing protein RUP2-like [Curcuma longa]|uniref:WD repeat-containing protein RUP2-like n=1 Tax=Curcuma longa TaxID=136217 RepID=UPI003D9E0347
MSGSPADDSSEERAQPHWCFRLSSVVSPGAAADASDAIGAVEFDPTGRLLATAGIARKIRLYSLSALLPPADQSEPRAAVSESSAACRLCICAPAKLSSLRWRPGSDGRVIGSGDYDGVVTEYDVERNAVVLERDEHGGRRVWSVDYSARGELGASGSDDGTVQLWDPRCGGSGRAAAVMRAGGPVCGVEFDPEGGPWVAAGSADQRAYVFDARAAAAGPVATLGGHERAVTYARFTQGGRRLVTSGTDGTHRLWDWEQGRQVRAYRGHCNARSFVGMSVWRGAGLIGSGSESEEVFVYDLRWEDPIWVQGFWRPRQETGSGRNGFVGAVSWMQLPADGEPGALAAGASDGTLQVFVTRKISNSH